ncbi:MAG: ATP-binding cassette domain-containing protein [Tissierellia bacterium]|nr:ATP-binding cassette domain-containing protein [Tissierellia bacterium]
MILEKKLGLRSIKYEKLDNIKSSRDKSKRYFKIDYLYHEFLNQKRALEIKDLKFNYGDIIGIYGYNGIGKSTFIRSIMGLEKSKSSIRIDDRMISSKKRRNKSFLVMQDVNHQLFTDSVEKEVSIGKADIFTQDDVDQVLESLDLLEFKNAHPMSLSGGQKQRVAIATAILSGSELICYDECTSGMDYMSMIKISDGIKNSINSEKIIFIISHDNEFLNSTANHILYIDKFNKKI